MQIVHLCLRALLTQIWLCLLVMAATIKLNADTPCTYELTPRAQAFHAIGGGGSFQIITATNCSWTLVASQPWIVINGPTTGAGPMAVNFHVPWTSSARSASIQIGPVSYSIAQSPFVSLPSSATTYLAGQFDQFQNAVYVYKDADSAGNHFAARGKFYSGGGADYIPNMDEVSKDAPCFDGDCITAFFHSAGLNYGGWYFMNGTLTGDQTQPQANWGTVPNAGIDLTGATQLRFWARGHSGGEVVQFFAGGIGYSPDEPYPDSFPKTATPFITLTTQWTEYVIDLTGQNLSGVLGGFGWTTNAPLNNQKDITFYLDGIRYIKGRPNDPHFIVSYQTQRPEATFDAVNKNAAYSYDNAVALMNFVAAGDVIRAKLLADAFVYALHHDREFAPGRVRNAYAGGDLVLPLGWTPHGVSGTVRMPGWYDPVQKLWFEDDSQVSTSTGNAAWVMLALEAFYSRFSGQEYLDTLIDMANWVESNAGSNLPGFTGGWDFEAQGWVQRGYKSSEHNLDLWAAFSRLSSLVQSSPNPAQASTFAHWAQLASSGKVFLLSMWAGDHFWTGTLEDGVTPYETVVPTDVQAWAFLSLSPSGGAYSSALSWVDENNAVGPGYGFKQSGNNRTGDKIWYEGTAQVGLANRFAGNPVMSSSIEAAIHAAQDPSGGVFAASSDYLDTGFNLNDGSPWWYFHRLHIAATGWLGLLEKGASPFWF